MRMRIGRMMVDTDEMTIDELTILINDLRRIRKRKQQVADFINRMDATIREAKEEGLVFLDKDYGNVLEEGDYVLFDERA